MLSLIVFRAGQEDVCTKLEATFKDLCRHPIIWICWTLSFGISSDSKTGSCESRSSRFFLHLSPSAPELPPSFSVSLDCWLSNWFLWVWPRHPTFNCNKKRAASPATCHHIGNSHRTYLLSETGVNFVARVRVKKKKSVITTSEITSQLVYWTCLKTTMLTKVLWWITCKTIIKQYIKLINPKKKS